MSRTLTALALAAATLTLGGCTPEWWDAFCGGNPQSAYCPAPAPEQEVIPEPEPAPEPHLSVPANPDAEIPAGQEGALALSTEITVGERTLIEQVIVTPRGIDARALRNMRALDENGDELALVTSPTPDGFQLNVRWEVEETGNIDFVFDLDPSAPLDTDFTLCVTSIVWEGVETGLEGTLWPEDLCGPNLTVVASLP